MHYQLAILSPMNCFYVVLLVRFVQCAYLRPSPAALPAPAHWRRGRLSEGL